MYDKKIYARILFASLALFCFSISQAEPMHHGEGARGKGHHQAERHGHGPGPMRGAGHGERKKGHKKSHMFTSHWAQTLSDDQKLDIDKMHLQVAQFEAVQKAKKKLLKAELNVLAANSPTDKKAMYAKIDEILEVKKSIMRNRYDHIVEMRAVLNKQQRISYDADLLKRKKHKRH